MPDFVVVGAGVSGLRAAIELAPAGEVLIVAKDGLRESSSEYAQGGVAVALGEHDDVSLHEEDTLAAGAGLCNPEAVRVLVREGPAIIRQLIDWGAKFDKQNSCLDFGREGAHSRRRVLHAHGDSTGREIAHSLYRKVQSLPNIRFEEYAAMTDLLVSDGEVTGVFVCDKASRRSFAITAKAVLLASGGFARIYKDTTNPDVSTGDGVAAAWRAGAVISDIEFVQFHPTALHIGDAPPFLLSEALRGEGGYLLNIAGERFMSRYHPLEELAPRDVVSHSIVKEMMRTGSSNVFLDLRHLRPDFVRRRFPRIYDTCAQYGLDIALHPVPVHPAAHYSMGGVSTDLRGRTSLPRLYAAGEVACTGVHGANRLASNSLLEGLVFGARAGAAMREWAGKSMPASGTAPEPEFPCMSAEELRKLAWENCGIVRSGEGLSKALKILEKTPFKTVPEPDRSMFELRNAYVITMLIARCALAREESRGAHYRTDFPSKRVEFQKHSVISLGRKVAFR